MRILAFYFHNGLCELMELYLLVSPTLFCGYGADEVFQVKYLSTRLVYGAHLCRMALQLWILHVVFRSQPRNASYTRRLMYSILILHFVPFYGRLEEVHGLTVLVLLHIQLLSTQ